MQMVGKHIRGGGERRGGVLAGCLIALAIVGVLVIAGGVFVAMNWRTWAGDGVNTLVEQGVSQSSLPESEKQEVMAVVSNFTNDFKAKKVSLEEFGKVLEELTQSPIMPAMIVMGIETKYITASDLSDEEKAQGSKDLNRFVRGVAEGQISQTKIDDVTEPISAEIDDPNKMSIHTGNLNVEIKAPANVTDDELRAFLANAKAEADAAGIPDEKVEVDWSDEIQAAIDRALGRAPALSDSTDEDAGDDAEHDDNEHDSETESDG